MFQAVKALSTTPVSQSIPDSNSPCSQAPMTLKVRKNTSAIIPMKAGMAVYRPVRMASIFRLRSCSLLSRGLTTVWSQSF